MWLVPSHVRARLDEVFRDRTLLVRDARGIRSLTLTARVQKTAVAAGMVFVLASAAAAVGVIWQRDALTDRTTALREVRTDYAELREKLAGLKAKADSLTKETGTADNDKAKGPVTAVREDLTDLARANRELTRRIARVRAGVRGADARADQLARQRDRLRAELESAKTALAKAIDQRRQAKKRIADLNRDVRSEAIENRARQTAMLSARRRSQAVKTRLAAARQRVTSLREEVGAVEERLAASRAKRQALLTKRTHLAAKVQTLENRIGIEGGDNMSLMARVANVAEALEAAEKRQRSLASSREKLQQRVENLEQRLAAVRERDAGLFKHLTARTRAGLKRVQRTVQMTGLDADKLAKRVETRRDGARGGPLIKLKAENPNPIVQQAGKLSRKVRRMLALQKAMGRMPLTAPVESYWISSYYGKRRDPYTDEWAMHEGLDLAADSGSAVKATAPGKVVFVGNNGGYGRMVKVDHGLGLTTVYGHLQSVAVDEGAKIDHRQKIGELGSTGRSTGPHVHYEVRMDGEPLDPMKFLKAGKHVFKG